MSSISSLGNIYAKYYKRFSVEHVNQLSKLYSLNKNVCLLPSSHLDFNIV